PRQLASTEVALSDVIRVPVSFGEREVWMVLSLGQPLSFLNPAAVDTLHIPLKALPTNPREFLLEVGGARVRSTGLVPSLKIGDYRFKRRDFFVDPRPSAMEARPEQILLGTVGIGDLWPVDFELDLARHRFNLYASDHCSKPAATAWQNYQRIPMAMGELG